MVDLGRSPGCPPLLPSYLGNKRITEGRKAPYPPTPSPLAQGHQASFCCNKKYWLHCSTLEGININSIPFWVINRCPTCISPNERKLFSVEECNTTWDLYLQWVTIQEGTYNIIRYYIGGRCLPKNKRYVRLERRGAERRVDNDLQMNGPKWQLYHCFSLTWQKHSLHLLHYSF